MSIKYPVPVPGKHPKSPLWFWVSHKQIVLYLTCGSWFISQSTVPKVRNISYNLPWVVQASIQPVSPSPLLRSSAVEDLLNGLETLAWLPTTQTKPRCSLPGWARSSVVNFQLVPSVWELIPIVTSDDLPVPKPSSEVLLALPPVSSARVQSPVPPSCTSPLPKHKTAGLELHCPAQTYLS